MPNFKNKKDIEYYQEVIEHKKKVNDIMEDYALLLRKRGYAHDNSKFSDSEFSLWVEGYIPENDRDIESEEYKETYEKIEKVRKIHYSKNRRA